MFKKLLILSILVILLFPLSLRAKEPIEISLNKESFKPGESIEAKAVFTNYFSEDIQGTISISIVSPDLNLPPFPKAEEIKIKPGESHTASYEMYVEENMTEGIYQVLAEIRDLKRNLITEGKKDFFISGTKKYLTADLQICSDAGCSSTKAVFIKGETVYLKLNPSGLTDLKIDARLKNSQIQEEKEITFANNVAQIKAEEEGGFIIKATLSKDGYSEQIIEKDFAVIAAPAEIKTVSVCNGDGKCRGGENIQNCPQDCMPGKKLSGQAVKIIIFGVAIIIIIIITSATYLYFVKKKKRENND